MNPARKGLGRGLDALLGDAPLERPQPPAPAREGPKTELPIEFLKPNPAQPRQAFDPGSIDELALSMKARGVLQPILVRPKGEDRYEIVAGERRWRAAQKAKLHVVPVIVRELTDEAAAEISLIENLQRVDLNPIEEAEAYRRLIDVHQSSQEDVARAVGKSRSHVANIIRLLKLPPRVREALLRSVVTMGHARALLTSSDPDRMCALVIKHGLSVRETEALVKREAARRDGASGDKAKKSRTAEKPQKDADTRALEADLAASLGLEVDISHTPKGSGAVTIRYLSLEQLDEVCRRLMGAGA